MDTEPPGSGADGSDLPSPAEAARRVDTFLGTIHDPVVADVDGKRLLARDLAALTRLAVQIDRLETESSPGVPHQVDAAFYRLVIRQRDLAWTAQARMTTELTQVRSVLHSTFVRADAAEDTLARVAALANRMEGEPGAELRANLAGQEHRNDGP